MRMQRTCNWRTFSRAAAVEVDFTTAGVISAVSSDPPHVEAVAFGAKAAAELDELVCLGQGDGRGGTTSLHWPGREPALPEFCVRVRGGRQYDQCGGWGRQAGHHVRPEVRATPESFRGSVRAERQPAARAGQDPERDGGKK
jgi:hypothetical protein